MPVCCDKTSPLSMPLKLNLLLYITISPSDELIGTQTTDNFSNEMSLVVACTHIYYTCLHHVKF